MSISCRVLVPLTHKGIERIQNPAKGPVLEKDINLPFDFVPNILTLPITRFKKERTSWPLKVSRTEWVEDFGIVFVHIEPISLSEVDIADLCRDSLEFGWRKHETTQR